MAFEKYTIRQFISAMFNNDRTVMSDEEYDIVYTEYIDVAGLYESDEFNKISYIHFLSNRVNSIKLSIDVQLKFLKEFDVPFINGFTFLKKFGYIVKWEENKQKFINKLQDIENNEKKFISQLEGKIKDLTDFREKKNKSKKPVEQNRGSFIKTLNSLGKIGWKIDNDRTTVEELAWMIKQQTEENKIR